MLYPDLWSMLGYTNNAWMMMEVFGNPSSIMNTENPPYTLDMFKVTFPVFVVGDEGTEGEIPTSVFNLFKSMADGAIKEKRYKSQWEYLMGLFIAHHMVLFLQTQSGEPGAAAALKGSLPSGVATSKSVDGLSISYDLLGVAEDLAGYGTWKLTKYGMQLATLTRIYGHAGMWVNG